MAMIACLLFKSPYIRIDRIDDMMILIIIIIYIVCDHRGVEPIQCG
jgi:hypothetical protein